MYPYNMPTTTRTTIKKDVSASESNTGLRNDEKILNMLRIALQEAYDAADAYQRLLAEKDLQRDSHTIRTAYLDELKHQHLIQEVFYEIFQETLPMDKIELNIGEKNAYISYVDAFEDLLHTELENIDFYRELFSLITNTIAKDMLLEIMMDKQDHAIRLQHLYCKYKK
jgi:rubrerythrin